MFKHWKITYAVACAVFTLGTLPLGSQAAQPSYQGRTLTQWLEKGDQASNSAPINDPAVQKAIVAMGTNALAYMMKWIRLLDSRPGPIKRFLQQESETFRQNRAFWAANGFSCLGTNADPAIPELTRIMYEAKDEHAARSAALALGNIPTEKAFTALITVLTNQQQTLPCPGRYYEVIRAFGRMGTNAAPAVPTIAKFLDGPDAYMASAAARVIGHLKLEPETVVPALIRQLDKGKTPAYQDATEALANFRGQAHAAVPILLQNLTNESPYVSLGAQRALRVIAPEVYTNAMLKALHDPNRSLRGRAAVAVRRFAPEALTNSPPK